MIGGRKTYWSLVIPCLRFHLFSLVLPIGLMFYYERSPSIWYVSEETYRSSNKLSPPKTAPTNTPSGFSRCFTWVRAPTISPTQCRPPAETIASTWSRRDSSFGSASKRDGEAWIRSGSSVHQLHDLLLSVWYRQRQRGLHSKSRSRYRASPTSLACLYCLLWGSPLGSTIHHFLCPPLLSFPMTSCNTFVKSPACEHKSMILPGGSFKSYYQPSSAASTYLYTFR